MLLLVFFFFFNQKTAYDMRISDGSSDVCSSDLQGRVLFPSGARAGQPHASALRAARALPARLTALRPKWPEIHWPISTTASRSTPVSMQIGRAVGRERVG